MHCIQSWTGTGYDCLIQGRWCSSIIAAPEFGLQQLDQRTTYYPLNMSQGIPFPLFSFQIWPDFDSKFQSTNWSSYFIGCDELGRCFASFTSIVVSSQRKMMQLWQQVTGHNAYWRIHSEGDRMRSPTLWQRVNCRMWTGIWADMTDWYATERQSSLSRHFVFVSL